MKGAWNRWIGAALIAALPGAARANKIIGNGGVVFLCDSAPRVRLVDFFEAEFIHYRALGKPLLTLSDPKGESYPLKVLDLLGRISRRFPGLSRALMKEFENFESHKWIEKDIYLGETNDDFIKVRPKGCKPLNIAIQQEPLFPRSPWFMIDQDLWDGLDERAKAGLVVHETLYRIGIMSSLDNSVGVRYLVGLLFANELDLISDEDWVTGFQSSRIPSYEIGKLRIPLFESADASCDRADAPVTSSSPGAKVQFANGRLDEVVFNSNQRIEFQTASGLSVCLLTSRIKFDWNRESMELVTSGRMKVSQASKAGVTSLYTEFDGRIEPNKGLLRTAPQSGQAAGRGQSLETFLTSRGSQVNK